MVQRENPWYINVLKHWITQKGYPQTHFKDGLSVVTTLKPGGTTHFLLTRATYSDMI
jgi:hypothetical protein